MEHHLEDIKEVSYRRHCTLCGQKWTREPVSECLGVPTYKSGEVPEGFYSMSRMQAEFRRRTDWSQPHAAVRKLHAPYYLYLYDINRCDPIPISASQAAAAQKRKETLQGKWTCWYCGKYHRHRWQQEKFHQDLQTCEGCHWRISKWNTQIAWAQERVQENAQIAVFTRVWEKFPDTKNTLTDIEILRLDGIHVVQPETFNRDAFFTAIMAVGAIYAPHSYDLLYSFCDQQKYHMWETRHDFEYGVPLVRRNGAWTNASWHFGEDIYRKVAITDPYTYLCDLWGIEVDEQASQAEKMRRVILHVAQQEPLEATPPPAAEHAY